jgi:heme A synthase
MASADPSAAPRPSLSRALESRQAWLGSGFLALVVPTTCLIVLGALVRAHEAGLACPDWPLCFGELVPEFDLQIAFEWSHRALAGAVALGFAALASLAFRVHERGFRARPWILVAAVLLLVQILLGALTVWRLLASWTVTSHLVTGNAFNLALLCIGLTLREDGAGRRIATRVGAAARIGVVLLGGLLLLQIVLGGLVSSQFAGMACPEWPRCNGGAWWPSSRGSVGLHLFHRWNAVLLLAAAFAVAFLARREPRIRGLAWTAAALGTCQLVVGIANVLLAIPVEVTGLHSALAALLILVTGALVREAFLAPDAMPTP